MPQHSTAWPRLIGLGIVEANAKQRLHYHELNNMMREFLPRSNEPAFVCREFPNSIERVIWFAMQVIFLADEFEDTVQNETRFQSTIAHLPVDGN